MDFTQCITGNETPQQIKTILWEHESRRLAEKGRLLKEEAKKTKKAGKLMRAKARIEQGLIQATMFYYDKFEKYHSLANALASVLTSENRDIMQERTNNERIPAWRRETIKWALEQGDMIRKCAKDLETLAEDGATGNKSRDNLAARFNVEMVPRSWNQILDQLVLNRDEALAEQRKEGLIAKCRSNGTALQSAERKIKNLEGALANQERSYQNLRKRLSQARQDCTKAQMECADMDIPCQHRGNTKRKRNKPVHNSEDGRGKTTKQNSGIQDEGEGSSPAGLRYLPFRCSRCSPVCKELATCISKG